MVHAPGTIGVGDRALSPVKLALPTDTWEAASGGGFLATHPGTQERIVDALKKL